MPKAVKPTKVFSLKVETIINNEKNESEMFVATFSGGRVSLSDGGGRINISRDFLPEFLSALQTTYPDAFALIDKHQKPQK